MLRWYVIHTKPKQEDRAHNNLHAWGVDAFAPRLLERYSCNSVSGPAYRIAPLFPGYIFARFDVERSLRQIQSTRGVHTVVAFGNAFIPVEEDIIRLIRSRTEQEPGRISGGLRYGDKVLVRDGPLKNLVGIFEREMKGGERVSILLTALGYQARVVVEQESLARVPGTS